MRALIVDDSRAIRGLIKRSLIECGFDDFVEAGDGQEALGALVSGPIPEAAFVDWNMPVMNGLEFVQAVRSDDIYDCMAVVMVTSETAIEQVEEALEAGADEYVMKPFTAEVLEEKLALVRMNRG
jgi:two-component system chemotaxis response regulator CheY